MLEKHFSYIFQRQQKSLYYLILVILVDFDENTVVSVVIGVVYVVVAVVVTLIYPSFTL